MCTVTFIPSSTGLIITANRDEKRGRSRATPPAHREAASGTLLCPGDPDGGGTWLAVHEDGHAVVFLNGGLVAHVPDPPYKRSRGLVLLDLVAEGSPLSAFEESLLDGIEPFTAVVWSGGSLHDCRWDGERKHVAELDAARPRIWSSVTLYDPSVVRRREQWFGGWLAGTPRPGIDDILAFHLTAGEGDACNDLRMDREGGVCTVSVTSMELRPQGASMRYLDLLEGTLHTGSIRFRSTSAQPG